MIAQKNLADSSYVLLASKTSTLEVQSAKQELIFRRHVEKFDSPITTKFMAFQPFKKHDDLRII